MPTYSTPPPLPSPAYALEGAVCLRHGQDSDASSFITLIDACWSQYPGIVLDVDSEMPELRALATHYMDKGGALWSTEAGGQIVGMVATIPHDMTTWEICRVYTHPSTHGSGLGQRLLSTAETHAREAGAKRLVLWSDTRFARAHRFYEKHGYVRRGPIRVLHDRSHSLEFGYAKPVAGVERLDTAAAVSAERRLTEILCACVDAGASVSYMPPLAADVARGFWKRAAAEVAAGTRIMLAAWHDATLVATVMLEFASSPNQPHRAEVQKLLVHPDTRRRGLARALMAQVETEARRAGKTLLTLDTRAGDAAERLYRDMGWREAGRIPGFALNAGGEPCDTVFFWKTVPPPA